MPFHDTQPATFWRNEIMSMRVCVLSLAVLAALPSCASANSLLFGTLNATGIANISLGSIAFMGNDLEINPPAAAQQGGFAALAGTSGVIQNITNPPDPAGAVNIPDFITFNADPNVSITLTFLYAGTDGAPGCLLTPPAAGQVCTPQAPDLSLSPFDLTNTSPTSSIASFNVFGYEVDNTTGDMVGITGALTTPFTSQNFQQLLAIMNGSGTVTTSFAAQFQTVETPEPGSMTELIVGVGLMGIAWLCRKPSAKNSR
jgi:hypothetical protein